MKQNKMLVVLGYNSGDAVAAERLLDWCYELNDRKKIPHPLAIVAAPNVHPELQAKVRIAGEVAFAHVRAVRIPGEIGDKVTGSNRLFKAGASLAANAYRAPWLWIEPDCVPLRHDWLEILEAEYDAQPMRFFGPHFQFSVGPETKMCLGRVACYPNNAIADLSPYCDSIVPFNQVAAEVIVARSTKGRIIQQLDIRGAEDFSKIRPDAVLLHSDKTGGAIDAVRKTFVVAPQPIPHPEAQGPVTPERGPEVPQVKIDRRTKAGRALNAAPVAV